MTITIITIIGMVLAVLGIGGIIGISLLAFFVQRDQRSWDLEDEFRRQRDEWVARKNRRKA